jgi:hypothetical protein
LDSPGSYTRDFTQFFRFGPSRRAGGGDVADRTGGKGRANSDERVRTSHGHPAASNKLWAGVGDLIAANRRPKWSSGELNGGIEEFAETALGNGRRRDADALTSDR